MQSEPPRNDDSWATKELCGLSPLLVPGHQMCFLLQRTHVLPTLPFITGYSFIPTEAFLVVLDVPGQI